MRLAAPFSLQFALADAIDNPPPSSVIYFAKLIYIKNSLEKRRQWISQRGRKILVALLLFQVSNPICLTLLEDLETGRESDV